jgi:L-fuculose-phosphate aldolase
MEDGNILCTPTAISKGYMTEGDPVIVDADGKMVSGSRKVSSEIAMHLLIYKLRADVHSVVHAHPPCATGYAAAGMSLNKALVAEVVMTFGCIPLAPYGTTGTPELTEAIRPFVPSYDGILLANHGVVTYGSDVYQAHAKMETVEHFARISLTTSILGKEVLLSSDDVSKLLVPGRSMASKRPKTRTRAQSPAWGTGRHDYVDERGTGRYHPSCSGTPQAPQRLNLIGSPG